MRYLVIASNNPNKHGKIVPCKSIDDAEKIAEENGLKLGVKEVRIYKVVKTYYRHISYDEIKE